MPPSCKGQSASIRPGCDSGRVLTAPVFSDWCDSIGSHGRGAAGPRETGRNEKERKKHEATAARVEATAEDGGRRPRQKRLSGFIGRPERDTPADSLSTPGRDNHLITPDASRRAHAIPSPPPPPPPAQKG